MRSTSHKPNNESKSNSHPVLVGRSAEMAKEVLVRIGEIRVGGAVGGGGVLKSCVVGVVVGFGFVGFVGVVGFGFGFGFGFADLGVYENTLN